MDREAASTMMGIRKDFGVCVTVCVWVADGAMVEQSEFSTAAGRC